MVEMPSDREFEPELGTVVGHDGFQVIEPGLRQRLDQLEDLDGPGRAGQAECMLQIVEIELQRFEGLGVGLP
jgi:hypothetical protein